MIASDPGGRWRIGGPRRRRVPSQSGASAAFSRPGWEVQEGAERFLREHPGLRPFLYETGDKVREYFDPDARLVVERFVDPESSSAPDELFVRVKTSLDVDDARERLGRFESEWWLDNIGRGDFLINVTLEFV